MNVHLSALDDTQLLALIRESQAHSSSHTLVDDPTLADLILLIGSFSLQPERLLRNPLYQAFPDRCAVYTEDDLFLPLAPGVYTNAHIGRHTKVGRIFCNCYLSRHGAYKNHSVADGHLLAEAIPAEQRKYLFSFQGGSTSLVRKRLYNQNFSRVNALIQNTSAYRHWNDSQQQRQDWQRSYVETMVNSLFVLCPRGAGVSSIRLFEVMEVGVAPVMIADKYQLPTGPEWDKFLIKVRERDIARLPEILEPLRDTAIARGRLAREAFIKHFSPESEFDRLVGLAADSLRHGGPSEAAFRRQQATIIAQTRVRREVRARLRAMALSAMEMLRIRNPYALARPKPSRRYRTDDAA